MYYFGAGDVLYFVEEPSKYADRTQLLPSMVMMVADFCFYHNKETGMFHFIKFRYHRDTHNRFYSSIDHVIDEIGFSAGVRVERLRRMKRYNPEKMYDVIYDLRNHH